MLEQLPSGISVDVKIALGEALESAFALGRLDKVEELLGAIDAIPPGKRPPSLVAHAARFRALTAAARDEHDGVEQGFKTAEAVFREHGLRFHLAVDGSSSTASGLSPGAGRTRRSRSCARPGRSSSGSRRRRGSSVPASRASEVGAVA